MVAVAGQTNEAVISQERIDAFLAEWQPRCVYQNFSQMWLDSETGELVDFTMIEDPDELHAASVRAERQYLRQIDEARQEWVGRQEYPAQRRNALLQFECELCERDLYYLTKFVLGYMDMEFHLHYFMCDSMRDLRPGYRGLREFPRDHYKTTTIGIGGSIQRILKHPDIYMAYVSNAQDNARNKVVEIKGHFIEARREVDPRDAEAYEARHPYGAGELGLQVLYPQHVPTKVSQHGSESKWTTPARKISRGEATITALGVGKRTASQHYELIVCDDLWDRDSVGSAETLGKCRKMMAELVYLLAKPSEGQIVYIATRWSHDDPTVDLLEDPAYHCVLVSALLKNGRTLFPEHTPITELISQSGKKYVFSCQMMLNPSDADQGFERKDFRYLKWDDIQAAELRDELATRKVILVDAAVDKKAESDFIAIQTVVIDSLGRKTVVEYIREQMAPSAFLDEVFRQFDKWRPEFVVRQKAVLETTLMSFVDERNKKRRAAGQVAVPFYDYSLKKREKKQRITASLQPLFSEHELYFDPDMQNLNELEKELLDHPNSHNDDGIDALSTLDDPVVNAVPKHRRKPDPPPETFIPTEDGQSTDEMEWRQGRVKRLFAELRGGKSNRRQERPGMVMK